jgi:hypothetical protein
MSEEFFKYTILHFHPNPELGEHGNRMAIALVVLPARPGEEAILCIDHDRIAAIPDFGGSDEDLQWVTGEFLADFQKGLIGCVFPEMVIVDIERLLAKENEILRFSEIREVRGCSKEAFIKECGFRTPKPSLS